MPTGTLIAIPSYPPAPKSIQPAWKDIVGSTTNTFNDQQQFMNWSAGACEISVTLPPLDHATASNWIAFLKSLQGMANYFTFTDAFCTAYPDLLLNSGVKRNWRLKSNTRTWILDDDRNTRITFEAREAF